MKAIARRQLLIRSGAAGLGLVVPAVSRAQGPPPTPAQTEGPFYPVSKPESDADLTRIAGSDRIAKGTTIVLDGTLRSVTGAPLTGAIVEIWQACASGRYNHPRDRNPAPVDPDFQYWARAVTDASGHFGFRSIKPGAYPNDPTWMRPPHIHFRVIASGYPTLTTQMYFEGEKLNDADRILQALTPAQRQAVVVAFNPSRERTEELAGRFDIVLAGAPGDPAATPELD